MIETDFLDQLMVAALGAVMALVVFFISWIKGRKRDAKIRSDKARL